MCALFDFDVGEEDGEEEGGQGYLFEGGCVGGFFVVTCPFFLGCFGRGCATSSHCLDYR